MRTKVAAITERTKAGAALTYRKLKGNPPSYRVIFDGVEIGSISLLSNYITNNEYWHWCIDAMPYASRPACGDDVSFEKALNAFELTFTDWRHGIPAEFWQKNLEHKRAEQARVAGLLKALGANA